MKQPCGLVGNGLQCLAAAALLVALFVLLVFGQAPPPVQLQQIPLVKLTTRLMQVSVTVHDKRGEPVKGLAREDFTLFEDRRQQPISFFSVESQEAIPLGAEPLPANTFSNHAERQSGRLTSVSAILVDGLNTNQQELFRVRHDLILFIQQLKPDDRLAIYTLGRELRVLHDFSSNAASLLRALGKAGAEASEIGEPLRGVPPEGPAGEVSRPAAERISDFSRALLELGRAQRWVDPFEGRHRADATVAALAAIGNRLAGFPGRKNLIWISGSFPVDPLPCDT
jgi:VWFA-related protein